jgi:hypothetical protein
LGAYPRPGGAVNVLGRQRIGPFDVTRLTANDPTALATWLADKGFPRPDGLDANLAPYIADHWKIVAIQLAAAEAGESLPVADHKPSLEFAGHVDRAEHVTAATSPASPS